jgi:hypothetical protein
VSILSAGAIFIWPVLFGAFILQVLLRLFIFACAYNYTPFRPKWLSQIALYPPRFFPTFTFISIGHRCARCSADHWAISADCIKTATIILKLRII